ncbi:hypothetical protein J2W42_003651 [Rhizobium tibeticum]|uniref:hypothetical protein n=1 Tax=Rhizobium tibeticum TaxID=501024 RepID=UPI002784630C|nr:hypothetical protein [Rhizobium tibeticum]
MIGSIVLIRFYRVQSAWAQHIEDSIIRLNSNYLHRQIAVMVESNHRSWSAIRSKLRGPDVDEELAFACVTLHYRGRGYYAWLKFTDNGLPDGIAGGKWAH